MDSIGSMGSLYRLTNARTRSISSENPTGGKGAGARCPLEQGSAARAARDLGFGWKVNPCSFIQAHEVYPIADIEGPGCIRHIWMTAEGAWRNLILRIYWEDMPTPAVECPLGDFFACGWQKYAQISSLAVCVNPARAFNCYWPMPFRKRCRITIENRGDAQTVVYYTVNYTLEPIEGEIGYFCAQFRRVNPLPYKEVYTILDGVAGKGQYVGTYMAWGVHNNLWWGEGEIKFYMDGDREFPTICGTGTEDYFGGSYNFEDPVRHDRYLPFTTPYSGLAQVITPDALYNSQMRFGLYRWHLADPIYFDESLEVTIQALGLRSGNRYMPLQDDIASVAYWYQTLPVAPFPPLPDKDYLEII